VTVIPDQNPGRKVDPKQARQRKLLFLALGGAVALALFLGRRSGGSAQQQDPNAVPTADPNATGLGGGGSTFADNGGQAAQLGNDVTGALGGFGTHLDDLTGAVQGLIDVSTTHDDGGGGQAAPADASIGQPFPVAAAAAPAGSPAGGGISRTAQAAKTILKPSAAHHGELSVYHVYAGKQPVYVRPANTSARKPAGSPSGAHVEAHHAAEPKNIVKASAAHHGQLWVYHVYPGRDPVAVRPASHK
jgi:hypothetical protein